MVMLEDFTRNYQVNHFKTRQALQIEMNRLITQLTHRSKVINANQVNIESLCKMIALSEQRIAAITLTSTNENPVFYKRVKQLASAEGALVVLDLQQAGSNNLDAVIKHTQAEIICHQSNKTYELALIRSEA